MSKASLHASYSGDISSKRLKIASSSSGSLVILCIGNIRNECIANDWHTGLTSSSLRASTNLGLPLNSFRILSWSTWLEQYLT